MAAWFRKQDAVVLRRMEQLLDPIYAVVDMKQIVRGINVARITAAGAVHHVSHG